MAFGFRGSQNSEKHAETSWRCIRCGTPCPEEYNFCPQCGWPRRPRRPLQGNDNQAEISCLYGCPSARGMGGQRLIRQVEVISYE